MITPQIQRLKYIAGDWLSANVAFMIYNFIRYHLLYPGEHPRMEYMQFVMSPKLALEQAILPLALLFIYWLSGYYNEPLHKSRMQELLTTVLSTAVCSMLIYLALLTNDQVTMVSTNYLLIFIMFGLLFSLTYIPRLCITETAIRYFRNRGWAYPTLVAGTPDEALAMAKQLENSSRGIRYSVRGFINMGDERISILGGLPVYDSKDMAEAVRSQNIEQIVIAAGGRSDVGSLRLLYKLFPLGVAVKIAPDTLNYVTSGIRLQDIFGEPLVDLTTPGISDFAKNAKRLFDIIMSLTALTLLSLPMCIIAIAVRRSSKGPVIYAQERIGFRQKPFRIYKFRTMRTDAESTGPQLSADDDPRVTALGKTLRKYRLDELPQFWNVLKGDMSLVGPRPERAYFIEKIVEQAPYYTLVHQVRPGITSWGMVKYGYASSVEQMVKRTHYDLIYLSNMSNLVDLKILVYTIKTVVSGKGV